MCILDFTQERSEMTRLFIISFGVPFIKKNHANFSVNLKCMPVKLYCNCAKLVYIFTDVYLKKSSFTQNMLNSDLNETEHAYVFSRWQCEPLDVNS